MSKNWKGHLLGFAVAALCVAPTTAIAGGGPACGDLNDDSNVNIVDVLLMANCVAGLCDAGAQCGGGGLAACANTFGDGAVVNASDLNQLVFEVAGLETLHDLCAPIGTPLACAGTEVITGTISSSQIWPSGCDIELDDTVFIETPPGGPTTVLTIGAGTTIKGRKTVTPGNGAAALIFLPGSKIAAIGGASTPIVFTSDQPAGARTKGDWGGVMFNGRSTVNRPNCLGTAEGVPSPFGGCDANDSSGVARYVRIEFAGLPISANNELNIWTMNGLGKGTDFSYIHANAGIDDCIEWFGGTLDTHHMVASGCADDGLDWQLGYTGTTQYALYVANGPLLDDGNTDSRGFEGDNSEFGNDDLPRSNPKFCNVTLVGPEDLDTDSDSGILFRRGTAGQVGNVIVTGFRDAGVELREDATGVVACAQRDGAFSGRVTGNLVIDGGVFYDNGTRATLGDPIATEHAKSGAAGEGRQPALCSTADWLDALDNVTENGTNPCNPGLEAAYPDPNDPSSLFAGAPTFTGDCDVEPVDCTLISDAFEDAPFIGAFDPAGPATGWLNSDWNSFEID